MIFCLTDDNGNREVFITLKKVVKHNFRRGSLRVAAKLFQHVLSTCQGPVEISWGATVPRMVSLSSIFSLIQNMNGRFNRGSSDISSDYHLLQFALYLLPSLQIRLQILSVAYSYLRFMLYLE